MVELFFNSMSGGMIAKFDRSMTIITFSKWTHELYADLTKFRHFSSENPLLLFFSYNKTHVNNVYKGNIDYVCSLGRIDCLQFCHVL